MNDLVKCLEGPVTPPGRWILLPRRGAPVLDMLSFQLLDPAEKSGVIGQDKRRTPVPSSVRYHHRSLNGPLVGPTLHLGVVYLPSSLHRAIAALVPSSSSNNMSRYQVAQQSCLGGRCRCRRRVQMTAKRLDQGIPFYRAQVVLDGVVEGDGAECATCGRRAYLRAVATSKC
jgi:hypothetical protein